MKKISGLSIIVFLLMSVNAADARGESSYRPDVRVAKSTRSSHMVTKWVWANNLDSPPIKGDMLAAGDGVVAFRVNEHVCGFSETNGRRLWCSEKGDSPAFASGIIGFSEASHGFAGVDARRGTLKWRLAPQMFGGLPISGDDSSIFSVAGNSFLLFGQSHGSTYVAQSSPLGNALWSMELKGALREPEIVPPYILETTVEAGATLSSTLNITHFQSRGLVSQKPVTEVDSILDVSLPIAIVSGSWTPEEVDDRFLTFDIEKVDVPSSKILGRYHFEPDYDENYRLYAANQLVGKQPQMRADLSSVYITLADKIYRYNLASPDHQRPQLIATNATIIGGPADDNVIIKENDGIHAISVKRQGIRDTLITSTESTVSAVAIDGTRSFLGFQDGRFLSFDLDSGELGIDTSLPCVPERFSVSATFVSAVCTTSAGKWSVYQFTKK